MDIKIKSHSKIIFYLFLISLPSVLYSMEEKQSVQKEQQPQVFQFFPQLDPELQTIVLNNLPNDDIALKYLTQCFSNEEGTKKLIKVFYNQ
jgi:hypothetical protein